MAVSHERGSPVSSVELAVAEWARRSFAQSARDVDYLRFVGWMSRDLRFDFDKWFKSILTSKVDKNGSTLSKIWMTFKNIIRIVRRSRTQSAHDVNCLRVEGSGSACALRGFCAQETSPLWRCINGGRVASTNGRP